MAMSPHVSPGKVVVHQGPDLRYLAQIMAQPDGTFLVSVGATAMSVMGSEEALGLRLRLDGVGTIMLPTVYDPSELRSEFNGKAGGRTTASFSAQKWFGRVK